MPRRWRPPPSWPPPPHRNWSPPPGWRPDPSWPPPPPGWQFWQTEASRGWLAVPAAVLGVLAIGVVGSLGDDGPPVTTSPVLAEETATPAVPTTPTAAPALAAPAATRTTTAAPTRTSKPAAKPAAKPTTAKPEPSSRPKPRRTATKAPSRDCDPNYAGACVPVASDVDCGSGSGNGPAYLHGTARVIGDDVYDLDRDGDGIACEQG